MLAERIYLPASKSIFQPGLALGQANWYAVHTVARHEKRVRQLLQEKRVMTFLPLVAETHRWTDRNSRIEVPLFSCYLFVQISASPQNRIQVLQTPGVRGVVGNGEYGTPVGDQEIESLRRAVDARAELHAHPFVSAGTRVRIRGGALDGVEGVATGEGTDRTVVLSVELLQRSVSVRVEGYSLELA